MSEGITPAGSAEASKSNRLLRSSAVVGVMTMLSRVLGLARDVVFANFIAAQPGADAFFVAFKIPQFFRRLFAEGAFSQAFVPVLTEYKHTNTVEAMQGLIDRIAGLLGGALLLFTSLVVVGAPYIAALFAPGWYMDDPVRFGMVSDMIRITFPYLFFISLTGFAGAILNSHGRFAVPAFTPVLLNISLITAALWGAQFFEVSVYGLAWGVFIAGVVQLLFQFPFLMRLKVFPKPKLDTQHEGVRKVLVLMVPALFGVSVSQINLLLDTVLASFLPTGSVSWLYYSDRLAELPLGVFAIAIATVILPSLSKNYAEQAPGVFSATLDWSLRMVFIIAIPATTALFILSDPILITLFKYGGMREHDINMASLSMRAYAFGLTAYMLIKVLAPGYFSRQDTKTPVRIGIVAMVSNMVLNILFVVPLHTYWQVGHLGLAMATAIAAFINAGLLLRGLLKAEVYALADGWMAFMVRLVLANSLMGFMLFECSGFFGHWLEWEWSGRLWRLVLLCFGGVLTYGLALRLLGMKREHLKSPG